MLEQSHASVSHFTDQLTQAKVIIIRKISAHCEESQCADFFWIMIIALGAISDAIALSTYAWLNLVSNLCWVFGNMLTLRGAIKQVMNKGLKSDEQMLINLAQSEE